MNKGLKDNIGLWHDLDQHQNIVDAINKLNENEKDYETECLLARAYNNLELYNDALEILLKYEEEGENDPLWHFRVGYAYFYKYDYEKALKYFKKSKELGEEGVVDYFLGEIENELKEQSEADKFYEGKERGLEAILGKMHDMVGHAIIPFSIGGAVDMYYFPNHIKGTGFATMEILDPKNNSPLANKFGRYELVAFTKEKLNTDGLNGKQQTKFNKIEREMCGVLTSIGAYSQQAILNPLETCEIPNEGGENTFLIFDKYEPEGKKFMVGDTEYHLLLCLRVFKEEMNFARENGTEKLIEKLRKAEIYPYSDLDRESVV